MNEFITLAIAHDSTCEPGDEWLFHGMVNLYDVHDSLKSPLDAKDKELLDKDIEELHLWEAANEPADDDFNSFGCIMAIGFVVFLVGVAIWALA